MTPERWQKVKSVLECTLEYSPDDRERYLVEACGGDADLRREVDSLLAAYTNAGDRFNGPLVISDPMCCLQVGAYRLLRRLGSGGMGAVYLAARADEQFRRLAAVKFIRPELLDEATLRRFANERHTMAALDHPNIVKLLDGGTSENGMPYLVMDYVEGQPIDQFCRQRNLTLPERLELFRTLCGALHYAHQNLVVHRDLKPANILVTPQGVPKLLDFGIAKLLCASYAAGTVGNTRTAAQPMTPEYASPEQILGQPVTTASDIYSLGVLLYLLLADEHPFQRGTQSAYEVEAAICAGETRRPSERARPALARQLRGDLDTIVLTAMRPEPQRRYASADHLAEDVRRYLSREPLSARGDSAPYRARKFASRHRIALPVSAVAVIALAFLAAADHAHRVRAERRFDQLRAFSGFVIKDLDGAMRKGLTPARQMIAAKALEYLDGLAKETKNDASIERDLVDGYLKVADLQGNLFRENIGEQGAALQSARKALSIAKGLPRSDPGSPATRKALLLSNLKVADILFSAGQRAKALEHYTEAIGFAEGDWLRRAATWSKVSVIQDDSGDSATALESARHSERDARTWLAANPGDKAGREILAFATERAAWFGMRAGEPAGAEDAVREAVSIYETSGSSRRNLAMAYKTLAEVQKRVGKIDEALAACRKSLATSQALLGPDSRNAQSAIDVAQEYVLLVELLLSAKQNDEARQVTGEAVAYLKPRVRVNSPGLYYVVDYLKILIATPFQEFLKGEDLVALARQAVGLAQGGDYETLDLLAQAYSRAGQIPEAIEAETKAISTLPPVKPGRPTPEVRRNLESALTHLQARTR